MKDSFDEFSDYVDDEESGSYYFDDELERAHAEEQAAGFSTDDEYDDERDTHYNHRPDALFRYRIHDGEGDIGENGAPVHPRRSPQSGSSLQREPSNTTSMLPVDYVAAVGTVRRGHGCGSCCRDHSSRQRCVGVLLSSMGVFTLGFLAVLLGHAWLKGGDSEAKVQNDVDNADPWMVVEVVTYSPEPTEAPTYPVSKDGAGVENENSLEGKSANVTNVANDTAASPILEEESLLDDSMIPQTYSLLFPLDSIDLALGPGQNLYASESGDAYPFLCKSMDHKDLLVQAVSTSLYSNARVREISVQIQVDDDTDVLLCDDTMDMVSSIFHFVVVPANLTTEVNWTATMEFSEADTVYFNYSQPTAGLVMLVSPSMDTEVRWFEPSSHSGSNIFGVVPVPELGDLCPEESSKDVVWLDTHAPRVTLLTTEGETKTIYGCSNNTNVTLVAELIFDDTSPRNETIVNATAI